MNKHRGRFKQHHRVAIILVILVCMTRLSVNAQQRSNEKNKIRYTLPAHGSNAGASWARKKWSILFNR